jgi:hypothetical protein
MAVAEISEELKAKFQIREWRHAAAVLMEDFPDEWNDIETVLGNFQLKKSRIVLPGGSKSLIAGQIDRELTEVGWIEKQFETAIHVDDEIFESPTHKVDCFKNKVGLEIEWNNKDPFFDRDLNNFRLLFDLRALSVGVIVTRCDNLQAIFKELGKGKSYGNSTTHWSKLIPRLEGGGGGGCPVLVFGINNTAYIEDIPGGEIEALKNEYREATAAIKPIRTRFLNANKRLAKWTATMGERELNAREQEWMEAARVARDAARAEMNELVLGAALEEYVDREDLLVAEEEEDDAEPGAEGEAE